MERGGGEFGRCFSVLTYQVSRIQLSKYISTQKQIRLALKCKHPTPLEAITAFLKDDLRYEKRFENSLRYSDAISKIQTFKHCSQKLQHNSLARARGVGIINSA